jgi:hypothetical protein
MADLWTEDRVLNLAPDAGSASAGQGLGNARKWVTLGRGVGGRAVWGECQGSGKNPYQTRVDLSEPAFKCSCPSRKFPCKHAIGLMLVFARDRKAVKEVGEGEEPGWVSEWLASRGERAAKSVEKAADVAKAPADPEAKAKRVAKREDAIAAGLDALDVWLRDLVRGGLAAAQSKPTKFWEEPAARLVDAQAPGLARLLRELPETVSSGDGWQRRTMDRLGRIYLIMRAARNQEALPEDLRTETRTALGWTIPKEEVLAAAAVTDRWLVLGRCIEQEDRIRVQRTWLWGRAANRPALVLDFAAGPAPLDSSLAVGTEIDADLCFYPGSLALRALIKDRRGVSAPTPPVPGHASITAALTTFAQTLARCPWLERLLLPLSQVLPIHNSGDWLLADTTGRALRLSRRFPQSWHLAAMSGGRPLDVAGEWDGESFLPLSIWPLASSSAPTAASCKDVGLRTA